MLPDTTNELTAEQIQQLNDAKTIMPLLRKQIQRAKSAGIDVSKQEADLAVLEKQLDGLHRVYVRKLNTSISNP